MRILIMILIALVLALATVPSAIAQQEGLTLGVGQSIQFDNLNVDSPFAYLKVKAPVLQRGDWKLGFIANATVQFDGLEFDGGEGEAGGYAGWRTLDLSILKRATVSSSTDFRQRDGEDVLVLLEHNQPICKLIKKCPKLE